MIERLSNFSLAHIWLLSIAVSLAVIESAAVGMGMLQHGEITRDHLLLGLAVSLFVAGLLGGILTFLLARQKEAVPCLPHEAAEDTTSADAPEFDNAPEIQHGSVPPQAAPEQTGKNENSGIRRAIQNLDVLPAMPVIAQRLLGLNLNTEEGERMLLALIEQDPQISAKILGLANSAMLGASRNITSVKGAALLLGSKRVQSVATGIAIISLMTKPPAGEFNIQDLWLHSIRIAFALQCLAQFMPANMRPQDDQLFLAGMLHDIGYLVLAYIDPKLSDKLHNHLAAEPERPAMDIEREILDACHGELGAELARHWNLPEEIVAVLHYHHSPEESGAAIGQPLVRMIDVAQKMLPSAGLGRSATSGISDEEWEALGISPARAEEIKQQLVERAVQAGQFAGSFA